MANEASGATERFSKTVRSLREMKGISAAKLAADAGIGRNTLFLIESKACNVRLSTVEKLSSFFGVSPACFFAFRFSESGARRDARLWKIRSEALEEGFLPQAVARNVLFYRSNAGLTQKVFLDHSRLAHGHLSKIERTSPDLYIATLEKIAEELVVPLPSLLEVN